MESNAEPRRNSSPRWELIAFAAALATGLIWLATPWYRPAGNYSEEEHIGIHLANGDGFSSSFALGRDAPPTSWSPPVYPAIVALAYRWAGVRTPIAVMCVIGFDMLCRAAAAAALLWLGRFFCNTLTGLLAGAIFMLNPIFLHSATICWDNCLALALFLWLAVAIFSGRKIPMTLLGIWAGILLLTNTSYVLGAGLLLLMAARWNWRRFALAFTGLLLTLTPWTARNFAEFHRLFLVRGNAYTELWIGNQPFSTGWMSSSVMEAHPAGNAHARDEVVGWGEIAYFDKCRERFWNEFQAAPREFFLRCANRCAYLLFGEPSRAWARMSIALAVLGLAGAWTAWRMQLPIGGFTLAAAASVVPYTLTQVHDRYTLPVRAMLTLLAAIALAKIISAIRLNHHT